MRQRGINRSTCSGNSMFNSSPRNLSTIPLKRNPSQSLGLPLRRAQFAGLVGSPAESGAYGVPNEGLSLSHASRLCVDVVPAVAPTLIPQKEVVSVCTGLSWGLRFCAGPGYWKSVGVLPVSPRRHWQDCRGRPTIGCGRVVHLGRIRVAATRLAGIDRPACKRPKC